MSLEIILAPILTLIIVQAIKLATDKIKGNFDLKHLINTYGGMPSSHAAFVVALTSMVGFKEGLYSTTFAISSIFSILIISDAVILRRHLGAYGRAIKRLINKLSDTEKQDFPHIQTKLGHTFLQAIIGGIIGFIVAFLVQLLY